MKFKTLRRLLWPAWLLTCSFLIWAIGQNSYWWFGISAITLLATTFLQIIVLTAPSLLEFVGVDLEDDY